MSVANGGGAFTKTRGVTLGLAPPCTTVNRRHLQGGRAGGQAGSLCSPDAITLQAGEGEAYVGLAPA